jgi:hypothetical protein
MDGSTGIVDVALKIGVVEILDRDDRARATVPITRWPVTIGRSVLCDVVLDDEHVAAEHAQLDERDGALRLSVGQTLNGARVQRRRVTAGETVDIRPGAVFEIGGTRLRVRRTSDALAPERPLHGDPAVARVPLALLVAGYVAWGAAERWIDADPGSRAIDYAPYVIGTPIGTLVWAGCWALLSKLFRHRAVFRQHAQVAFGYALLAGLAGAALPLAAFASGWPFASRIAPIVSVAVVCAMVAEHARLVAPGRTRVLRLAAASLFVVGLGLFLARNHEQQERWFSELYVTKLGPPALRVAPPVEPSRFVEEARALKATLDSHRADESPASDDDF